MKLGVIMCFVELLFIWLEFGFAPGIYCSAWDTPIKFLFCINCASVLNFSFEENFDDLFISFGRFIDNEWVVFGWMFLRGYVVEFTSMGLKLLSKTAIAVLMLPEAAFLDLIYCYWP